MMPLEENELPEVIKLVYLIYLRNSALMVIPNGDGTYRVIHMAANPPSGHPFMVLRDFSFTHGKAKLVLAFSVVATPSHAVLPIISTTKLHKKDKYMVTVNNARFVFQILGSLRIARLAEYEAVKIPKKIELLGQEIQLETAGTIAIITYSKGGFTCITREVYRRLIKNPDLLEQFEDSWLDSLWHGAGILYDPFDLRTLIYRFEKIDTRLKYIFYRAFW